MIGSLECRTDRRALGFKLASPGEGVMEMRIDWGAEYRLYFALAGGDKTSQQKDIKRAKVYFQDFKARSAKNPRR